VTRLVLHNVPFPECTTTLLRCTVFFHPTTAAGQSATPTFATGMEEVASIADAGGHGTRFAAATTGPCPQYPSKPPPGPTGVISALGQNLPPALQNK
jgi:hypothetical protein